MEDSSEPVLAYRWVVMGIWLTASVSGFMIMSTIGILLPAISAEFGLSPFQQGMLGSAAYWGNLALAIPLGWWTSRFTPKILTTVTMVLGTLFLLAQALSPGFAALILGRMAFGISVIARQPARAFLTQQWFPARQVVLVNSISNAMFGLVVGGGVAASPFILIALGDDWRATLLSFVALFAVMTILWMIFGKERVTSEYRARLAAQDASVLKGTLRYRDLWIGGLGFVGATTAWSGFLSFYPTLMLDNHQMPLVWSGGILALGIFMGGICGLGFGWVVMVSDRGRTILLGYRCDDGCHVHGDDPDRLHSRAAGADVCQRDSLGILAGALLRTVPSTRHPPPGSCSWAGVHPDDELGRYHAGPPGDRSPAGVDRRPRASFGNGQLCVPLPVHGRAGDEGWPVRE